MNKYGKLEVIEIPGWLHGLDFNTKDTVDRDWWKEMYHPALDRLDDKLRAAEFLASQSNSAWQRLKALGDVEYAERLAKAEAAYENAGFES